MKNFSHAFTDLVESITSEEIEDPETGNYVENPNYDADGFSEFIYNKSIIDLPGYGQVKKITEWRENDGGTQGYVFENLETHEFFRVSTWYSSYDSAEWYDADVEKVVPVNVTVRRWKNVDSTNPHLQPTDTVQ